jgi:hypothetical protein
VYVAVVVLWGILNLMAETGLGRAAARFSYLVLLTGAVLGPFGARAVGFLEAVSQRFAIAPPAPASSSSSSSTDTAGALTTLGGFV